MKEIKNLAPIFGANTRPVEDVEMSELDNAGVMFDTYTIKPGQSLEFPEHMTIKKQPVRAGSENYQYLAACVDKATGKSTWFGLAALVKRDVNNVYVYPKWNELGNHSARVAKLAGMTLTATGKTIEIEVPAFNPDGTRMRTPKLDENGQPVLDEMNNAVLEDATRKQTVVLFQDAE